MNGYRMPKRWTAHGSGPSDNEKEDTRLSGYLLPKNVLAQTNKRIIELQWPVYVRYTTNVYPPGSATYGSFYTLSASAIASSVNPTLNMNTAAVVPLDNMLSGRSSEYVFIKNSWNLGRIEAIGLSFVRSYTNVPDEALNLPTLSLNIRSEQQDDIAASQLFNLSSNYMGDGSAYYQVVNNEKNVVEKIYYMPTRHIESQSTIYSINAPGSSNSWMPTDWVNTPFAISLRLGQNIPGITTINAGNFVVGSVFMKLYMEFAQPNTL